MLQSWLSFDSYKDTISHFNLLSLGPDAVENSSTKEKAETTCGLSFEKKNSISS